MVISLRWRLLSFFTNPRNDHNCIGQGFYNQKLINLQFCEYTTLKTQDIDLIKQNARLLQHQYPKLHNTLITAVTNGPWPKKQIFTAFPSYNTFQLTFPNEVLLIIYSFLDHRDKNNLIKVDKFFLHFISAQSEYQFVQKYPQILSIIPSSSPNWITILRDLDLFQNKVFLFNTSPIRCPLCNKRIKQSIQAEKCVLECVKCHFTWKIDLSRRCKD